MVMGSRTTLFVLSISGGNRGTGMSTSKSVLSSSEMYSSGNSCSSNADSDFNVRSLFEMPEQSSSGLGA